MTPAATPTTGLVLTGGGARAAYQVGVLEALVALRRAAGEPANVNPFPILTGTSAGAINAAALACGADHFDDVVAHVADVWRNFHAKQVYRADSLSMLRSGARWVTLLSLGWALTRWSRTRPRSLLDNAPLAHLLEQLVPLDRLPALIAGGHLQALAVTASSYSTGEHVTFYDAGEHGHAPWVRSQRKAVHDRITHAHLMASSAIPFIFPATALPIDGCTQYFGDGSMRQSAPIAPAIHLGAERILVVGAGRLNEPPIQPAQGTEAPYPSLAQVAGHALSNIFLDALAVDVERAQRINHTLSLIPQDGSQHSDLRPLELLVLSPSQRIDEIAARHVSDLPATIRALLGTLGARPHTTEAKGGALASYLLFEAEFTQELMALGRSDVAARRAEICTFFGWRQPQ